MELGAIMDLSGRRGESTGKKGTPYIVHGKDPTVTHEPAHGQQYYRAWPVVLPQGRAVLLLATKWYYRTAVRYYRTDPWYCRNPSTAPINRRTEAGGGTSARTVLPRAPMRYYREAKIPARGEEKLPCLLPQRNGSSKNPTQ